MKKKDASSTKEDEWLENQNLLMFKLIDSYEQSESGLQNQWRMIYLDTLLQNPSQKISDGEMKEELKIEIQQLILSSKRKLNLDIIIYSLDIIIY